MGRIADCDTYYGKVSVRVDAREKLESRLIGLPHCDRLLQQ